MHVLYTLICACRMFRVQLQERLDRIKPRNAMVTETAIFLQCLMYKGPTISSRSFSVETEAMVNYTGYEVHPLLTKITLRLPYQFS